MRIEVPITRNPYTVHVAPGISRDCGSEIRKACGGGPRCALLSDDTVAALHADGIRATLEAAGAGVTQLTVPAGESSKSFSETARLCESMAAAGLDRSSFVVALGGGVVGDLAGFVAAVFYRGIPFAQIPTTLLAQVDSSVGGKTGINLSAGKNLAGAFHQPRVVIADTELLATLPPRIFNEGAAECIKHGVIRDAELARRAADLARCELAAFVARNVAIKAAIVGEDEFETGGQRALLNFGHTVGHALEQAAGYGRLLHGEAIAIGMAAALELSCLKAGLPREEARAVLDSLRAFDLPARLPDGIGVSREAILTAMRRDKKFQQGSIRFVLCPRLGEAVVSGDVTWEDLDRVIRSLTNE